MKRIIATVLLLTMLMTMVSSVAMADVGAQYSFYLSGVQCTNTTNYTDARENGLKTQNNNSIYVRHWVDGGSSEYTNHFRGRRTPTLDDMENRTNCGAKWCTVGLNVPIQSNNITTHGYFYSIACRGNTNHYDYDGVSSVTLHGQFFL